jgi:DNA invertase Pin-like site-specific DNA recombinase
MNPPRIALYIRVSKLEQKYDSQEDDLLGYCERRGWKRPFQVYREKISGSAAARTEIDRMLTDARAGKFDVLVVYKMDRLGRSLKHLMNILGELKNLKISLVCSSQGIDTTESGPAAEMQMHVLGAMAQFESGLIRERTAAGLASARKRGIKLGRPRVSEKIRAQILALRKPDRSGRRLSYSEIAKASGKSMGFVWKCINGPSLIPPKKKQAKSPGNRNLQKISVL